MSRPWRALLPAVLFTLLLVPSQVQAHSVTWSKQTLHLDWKTASHVVRTETVRYPVHMSGKLAGYRTTTVRRSPHVLVRVRFPVFRTVPPAGRSISMLVTYYLATGSPMSNGIYPSVGWAACGYDLALGTRVSVPGVGVLTCGDRIGFQPYRHIDVFGVPLGSGYRMVQVFG